jgi:all-trans-8'-apo-beta-carotenal 15,15'-oxygenase
MTLTTQAPVTGDAISEIDVFRSVEHEHDLILDEITGTLPEGLTGTLYRNGPARWAREHAAHAFDGDGMITQLIFNGSSIRYRNRFVATPNHERGNLRGIGTQRPGGPLANAMRIPTERANTHAVVHAERLLALADYGRPFELDQDTLQTVGPCDFAGALSRVSLFSPHPKLDPHTGELFNFGLAPAFRFGLKPSVPAALRCYRIDPAGRMSTLATVGLDHLHINHDFAITERYLVFIISPLYIDEARALPALLGLKTYEWATRWHEQAGTRIVLVPRNGDQARVLECSAIPYVHLNNAFDDRDDVVADLIRYPSYDAFAGAVRDVNEMTEIPGGSLARMRITASGQVTIDDICTAPGELPQHDSRRTSRRYRYSYYTGTDHGAPAIIKADNDTATHQAHTFEPGQLPGEPFFVARTTTGAEDDGWLLVLVAHRDRTTLHILDATNPEADPIAIAKLPHYAFPGFHGSFTTRIAK